VKEAGSIAGWGPGRRGEILAAALEVFTEKGYRAGSMRDVAAVVGVTEPALYRHFAGKEELFLSLVRVVASRIREEAFGILDSIRPESLREQTAAALADRRGAIGVFSPVLRTLLTAAAHDPAVLVEIRAQVMTPIREHLLRAVERLDDAYGVDSDPASRETRARAFLSLFVGSLVTSVVIGDQPDEAMADAVIRLMGWEGKASELEAVRSFEPAPRGSR
jgi:AcrR family transcriptional regulator